MLKKCIRSVAVILFVIVMLITNTGVSNAQNCPLTAFPANNVKDYSFIPVYEVKYNIFATENYIQWISPTVKVTVKDTAQIGQVIAKATRARSNDNLNFNTATQKRNNNYMLCQQEIRTYKRQFSKSGNFASGYFDSAMFAVPELSYQHMETFSPKAVAPSATITDSIEVSFTIGTKISTSVNAGINDVSSEIGADVNMSQTTSSGQSKTTTKHAVSTSALFENGKRKLIYRFNHDAFSKFCGPGSSYLALYVVNYTSDCKAKPTSSDGTKFPELATTIYCKEQKKTYKGTMNFNIKNY